MKTAVEWFANRISHGGLVSKKQFDELLEQAKEMDKQSHKETWDLAHQAGRFEEKGIAAENWQTFETYWEYNI
jgi:hypothetical protein